MKRRKLNTNKVMGILFFFLLLTLGTCFFLKSDFFYLKEVIIVWVPFIFTSFSNFFISVYDNCWVWVPYIFTSFSNIIDKWQNIRNERETYNLST